MKLISFLLLLMPIYAFAFFCPSNFNQINLGMTIDEVTQICGPPTKQETKEQKQTGPHEWTYFVPQTVSTGGSNAMQGSLKSQFAFDGNGKLMNLSVNGIGVGSSSICKGQNIKLGDDEKKVKAACGSPTMVDTQGNPEIATKQSTTLTTFTYNSNPPVRLIFENGRLKRTD